MGPRAVPKRDISPCNYITQNKKLKLEHSAINAGSIDFCTAPSWLINSRCCYKPIPAPASLQQETNGRISKAEIPSCTDLLSPRSFKNHAPSATPLPKTHISATGVAKPHELPCWEMSPRATISRAVLPTASCLPLLGTGAMLFFWMGGTSHLHIPPPHPCKTPLTPWSTQRHPLPPSTDAGSGGGGDPLSFWGSCWKSLNLPQSIRDRHCCPSATQTGEHLPTLGACCLQTAPGGEWGGGGGAWMQEHGSGSQKITPRGVKLPLYPSTRIGAAGGADEAVTHLRAGGMGMGGRGPASLAPPAPTAPLRHRMGPRPCTGVGCSRQQGTWQHPPHCNECQIWFALDRA